MQFKGERAFEFPSAVNTPWPENNRVPGRLYRAGPDWKSRPSVILLHGWNGEAGYYWQFPFLAWLLNRAGVNAAMFELPYHGRRRPTSPGAIRNFLSHDMLRVAEAVQQSITDTRTVMSWLRSEGSPQVGVWGVSLGAWLTGLLAANDPELALAVLLTPVVRMDRAFSELDFCAPIREALRGKVVDLQPFNLMTHQLAIPAQRVLIVKSEHDLFAPAETVDELWKTWGRPEMWSVPHGHISVLLSVPILSGMVKWCAQRLNA